MEHNPRITIASDEELQLSPQQVAAIMADRATKLAQAYTQVAEQSARRINLIAFSRGAHRYAIELEHLTEIRPLDAWTRVPGVPEYFLGVVALRGEIIAVVDVAVLFGSETAHAAETFAVIVTADGISTAFLADSVDDVHDLLPEQIHPPLATFTSSRERYIRGLAEDGIAILDVERLLGDEWLRVSHDQAEERR